MYVDTHAHLYFDQFDDDREAVLSRAGDAGVDRIINIGINIETSLQSIAYADKYQMVYASAGVHPHDAEDAPQDYLTKIEEMIAHPKVVAIGEIGLDYYRDYSPRTIQLDTLRRQLDLAIAHDMPVIVHTRAAWKDIYSIFEGEYCNRLRGVFHCFSGEVEDMKRVLDLGFYISFTGVVTFKNASAIDVAAKVPVDRLMLETDCPFMAPVPYRGKRSEPAHVPHIAKKIAEVRGMGVEELGERTTQNAETLFAGLGKGD